MPFRILSTNGAQSFELREGSTLLVGRAASSDIPIFDPTISRRHASLCSSAAGVEVSDLGSSNGTFVNGVRVESAFVAVGDELTFGKVPFRLAAVEAPPTPPPGFADESTKSALAPAADATVVRQRAFNSADGRLSSVFRAASLAEARVDHSSLDGAARTEKKLALLLEVSKGLSRAVDVNALLDKITELVFQILDVDRVAIELIERAALASPPSRATARDPSSGKAVPQSIARMVVDEKVAVLSDNAPQDQRFGGQSILMQSVRSAMCAPLIGTEDVVQGVLYVDNITTTHRFGDEDLEFLTAFSNIAAVALENSRFAERIRHETMVRGNFERFFAPRLAAQIAGSAASAQARRRQEHGGGAVQRHPRLHGALRNDDARRRGDAVERVFHRDGGDRVPSWRDARQVHRRRGDGAVGRADRRTGRRRSRDGRGARHDARARDAQRTLGRRRAGRRCRSASGLSFGESFAGYIGSERRLEYTVIGDVVNLLANSSSRI